MAVNRAGVPQAKSDKFGVPGGDNKQITVKKDSPAPVAVDTGKSQGPNPTFSTPGKDRPAPGGGGRSGGSGGARSIPGQEVTLRPNTPNNVSAAAEAVRRGETASAPRNQIELQQRAEQLKIAAQQAGGYTREQSERFLGGGRSAAQYRRSETLARTPDAQLTPQQIQQKQQVLAAKQEARAQELSRLQSELNAQEFQQLSETGTITTEAASKLSPESRKVLGISKRDFKDNNKISLKERIKNKIDNFAEDLLEKGADARFDVERLVSKAFKGDQTKQAERRKEILERREKLEQDKLTFNTEFGNQELTDEQFEIASRRRSEIEREEADINNDILELKSDRNPVPVALGFAVELPFKGSSAILKKLNQSKEEREIERQSKEEIRSSRKEELINQLRKTTNLSREERDLAVRNIAGNFSSDIRKELVAETVLIATGADINDPLFSPGEAVAGLGVGFLAGKASSLVLGPLTSRVVNEGLGIETKVVKPTVTNTVREEIVQSVDGVGEVTTRGKFKITTDISETVIETDSTPKLIARMLGGDAQPVRRVVRNEQTIITFGDIIQAEGKPGIGVSATRRITQTGTATKVNLLEPAEQVKFNLDDPNSLTPIEQKALEGLRNRDGVLVRSFADQELEYTKSALKVTNLGTAIKDQTRGFSLKQLEEGIPALDTNIETVEEFYRVRINRGNNKVSRFDTVSATYKIGETVDTEIFETGLSTIDVSKPMKSLTAKPRQLPSTLSGTSKVLKEPINTNELDEALNSNLPGLDDDVIQVTKNAEVKKIIPTLKSAESAIIKQVEKTQASSSAKAVQRALEETEDVSGVSPYSGRGLYERTETVSISQFTNQFTTQDLMLLSTVKDTTRSLSGNIPIEVSISRSSTILKSLNKQGTDQVESLATVEREAVKVNQRNKQNTRQIDLLKFNIKIKELEKLKIGEPTTSPRPRIKPTTPRKRKGAGLSSDNGSQLNTIVKAYDVLLFSRGRYTPIATGLPRGLALKLGAEEVLNNLSRRFTIKESGETNIADIDFSPSMNKFRDFKVRRGQKITTPNTFIQKSGIDTSVEVDLLQQARRGKAKSNSIYAGMIN